MTILFLKSTAAKERAALLFLLKLLILGGLLKCIFFVYNYRIAEGWDIQGFKETWKIIKWSFLYDMFCLSIILVPFHLILFALGKYPKHKSVQVIIASVFTVPLTLFIFLNTLDIFYFRFHLQRADADLLYVLRDPFKNATVPVLLTFLTGLVFISLVAFFVYRNLSQLILSGTTGKWFISTAFLLIIFIGLFYLRGPKKMLPTFPLTEIKPVQLALVQNSFHSFIYSVYRRKETVLPQIRYMNRSQQDTLFSIRKKNSLVSLPKNIVLFIMESVPLDFFDSSSSYKVSMPFLDELVNKSTFYNNAFSYSYSSNKGITAILAGLPTLTDIPLYHSNYTSIQRTSVGSVLEKNNYRSAFFIGDNFDDFGFAKCSKWLGIQDYYSMESIPGYQKMEKHSMGLHDEYVLDFMQEKLRNLQQPFFAVQYNISTHYPNNVPLTFEKQHVGDKATPQMKSMQYYNDCLQQFFREASTQPWFKNSVFIFCSDHWAQPHLDKIKIDEVESFRIPLFIYDPSKEDKTVVSSPVSQLDIVNTVLYYAAVKDSFTSYGTNLKNPVLLPGRTIFTKTNTAIYQAINNEYVLGFNAMEGTAVYCFAYKKDPRKRNNLLLQPASSEVNKLILEMKAFLQTTVGHYKGEVSVE